MTGYAVTPGPDHRDPPRADLPHRPGRRPRPSAQDRAARTASRAGSCYAGPSLPDDGAPPVVQPARQTQMTQGTSAASRVSPASWPAGCRARTRSIYPENSGIMMQPGDALVLQIHYHYDTTPTPDRCDGVAPAHAGHRATIKELDIINPHRRRSRSRACPGSVGAAVRPRRGASPTTPGSTAGTAACIETGLLLLCGKTRRSSPPTSRTASPTRRCDYQVPDDGTHRRRARATCTRWARASG